MTGPPPTVQLAVPGSPEPEFGPGVSVTFGDPADPETADLMERVDRGAKGSLVLTFGGGVNEVQRELIAMLGLNLPRPPR